MMAAIYEECLDKCCQNPLSKLAKILNISTAGGIITRHCITIATYKGGWEHNSSKHHIKKPPKYFLDSSTW